MAFWTVALPLDFAKTRLQVGAEAGSAAVAAAAAAANHRTERVQGLYEQSQWGQGGGNSPSR